MKKTITFETKCWENDYEYILGGNYLEKMIQRANDAVGENAEITNRQLIINNIKDREKVVRLANKLLVKNVIDNFYIAEDTDNEVLKYFEINKNQLGIAYPYTISELTGIYNCKTDYLLHLSSDAFLTKNKKEKWISDAINQIENNYNNIQGGGYCVASPVWNFNKIEVKNESSSEVESFFISQGFSDQCYLIPISVFKKPIYNFHHEKSQRYPKRAGELFEKRVDSFLRANNCYRLISKKSNYIHSNFPKNGMKRFLSLKLANSRLFTFSIMFRETTMFSILIINTKQFVKQILRKIIKRIK